MSAVGWLFSPRFVTVSARIRLIRSRSLGVRTDSPLKDWKGGQRKKEGGGGGWRRERERETERQREREAVDQRDESREEEEEEEEGSFGWYHLVASGSFDPPTLANSGFCRVSFVCKLDAVWTTCFPLFIRCLTRFWKVLKNNRAA
jgi:hypothetical protein